MLFQFPAVIEAGIQAGKYAQVFSDGVPLSIARDAATGRFVSHAVGVVNNGVFLNPLTAVPQLVMGAGQLYQNHQTLQALKALSDSVATLQATTAVIGVGVAATAALSAVNLWQTLKLRGEVKQLRLEVKDGFINLEQALHTQGKELLQHIALVAEDVEFRNHRTILARAYGLFAKALNRVQSALALQDLSTRNAEITAARDMLFQALADYDNEQLLVGVCPAGNLRRRECVWAIEQAIAMTFQLQSEYQVVSDRLGSLNTTIRHDCLTALDSCDAETELDFLFPEITRIHGHDLAAIDSWKAHSDWYRTLPAQELKLLSSTELAVLEIPASFEADEADLVLAMPPEQILYDEYKQKSHFAALRDQLAFQVAPNVRRECETYIVEQAAIAGLNALNPENLQKASHLAIANLYSYFQGRDASQDEAEHETLVNA
ncbi:hypothetical protein H6F93_22725 [Leptolyngbya sp. FACHB-671]|uniref:hypothetical protein n=1 Tax=Leptolyngbya sp. FACHB-671 TaxID=2692812 RepID=UPI00168445C4|nr:hypothetical protein [Leptolyngbya sp. FACHB-671]MBD2070291.1 hypothetical protein [Leptolyngbya sp. FACHB-671]